MRCRRTSPEFAISICFPIEISSNWEKSTSDKNMSSGGRNSFSGLFRFRPLANGFSTKRDTTWSNNCCITEFAVSSVFLMLFGRNSVWTVPARTLQFRLFSFRFSTKSVAGDRLHWNSCFVDLAKVSRRILMPAEPFRFSVFRRFGNGFWTGSLTEVHFADL